MKINMLHDPRKKQAEKLSSGKAAYQKSRKKIERKLHKSKTREKRGMDALQETRMWPDARE